MEQILCGCEGCVNFIDDILVYGSSQQEHDTRLEKVQRKLQESNIKLKNEKCVYGASELKFLGHILSATGVKPDEDKLESIRNYQEPCSKEEIRSFLGLVNYVGKFIPDLATLTEPLRRLQKQQNGEVERQNRSILKRLTISQATDSDWKDDLNKYLIMYRSTPHSTNGKRHQK